jgi:glycosyltransferase involved in cell wall biosynthesis
MVKYGYCSADITDVVYLGADKDFQPHEKIDPVFLLNIRQKYSLPEKYLLYVGRLNVRKNIFNLLRAISLLRQDIPLVIVGDYDWKMPSLDDLIQELGIKERIVFTGSVPGKDLTIIYALAHLFCFPSYEEAFGLPALEGMASGVPIIVSDRSSLPEICGEAGNYVNPDSPENIAAIIDALMIDSKLREHKRQLGLLRAQQFKWEYSARDLLRHALTVCGKGN